MAVKIKWNIAGFREIRTSGEVEGLLQNVVDEMLSELGEGYEGDVTAGKTRSRGGIVTAEYEAIVDNAKNNSLVKALGGAHVG